MIYLTGDTHNDFSKLSNKSLKKHNLKLTEDDYIIVAGDFGLCWAHDKNFKWNCKWFGERPFTTLWIQGNHENYDMIAEYPLEEWHGGLVRHIVRDKVILLERGQIFNIEGHTFFTFGGAASHDIPGGALDRNDPEFEIKLKERRRDWIPYRIIGESWWPQELPMEQELQTGLDNLEKADFTVDYVITHGCATDLQTAIVHYLNKPSKADVLTDYFQALEGKLHYKHWYFGHYHCCLQADEKHTVLYDDIFKLDE